ncbi:Protein of unknown function [Devosia crocina]|uniref:DUF1353 domain-containing protein n=1 Tax=Devosia crocina TaxID=429728 RepID=A0A1I7N9N6_9HYPH|nr:DUF1353 domain-containing protein [Devosia crocina]SFV31377.1 Protein of unknown function [Devosia crocina]
MSLFTGSGAVYPFQAADTGEWSWVLAEDLAWEVRGPEATFTITVPAFFQTDLGSVPPLARWLINPADPQLAKAFVLHDYILQAFGPQKQPFAASQLYEALRALRAQRWKSKTITAAVVLGIDDW